MFRSILVRTVVAAAVALSATTALTACGSSPVAGPTVTQDRDVTGASAVVLAGVGRLDVVTGSTPELTITAGENVMPRITSEVDGDGVLVIDVRGPAIGQTTIELRLVLPTVEAITVSGAGQVNAKLDASDALRIDLSGAGDVAVGSLDVKSLDVNLSGAGRVTLVGEAARQTVVLSGLGSYDGTNLSSGDADVLVSGAGSADVLVSGTLTATVTGAGSITYAGSPTVTASVPGLGSVRERE